MTRHARGFITKSRLEYGRFASVRVCPMRLNKPQRRVLFVFHVPFFGVGGRLCVVVGVVESPLFMIFKCMF